MSQSLMTLLLAFAMMTALWPVSILLKDVSIIDILWAPAFAIVATACALLAPALDARAWIALALIWVWAIRLGSHVFSRWRRLGHEDYRYAAIRKGRGPNFPFTSLFWIFWLQALLLWIISWPLQAALLFQRPLNALDGLGIALVIAGIVIEGIADVQLTRFRADPQSAGRVLDTGLWSWSRHPNYFGDFAMWWGFFLLGLAAGGPWWLVLGPVVMSALLIHYSGAGLMEDTIVERRPGYADYVRRTSLFVPWPPSREKQASPSH
jgi:steroid 5-alpha reductase family enzyme